MEYKELIDAFAAKYGVTTAAGEDGLSAVEIDGTNVSFCEDADARAIILTAQVGKLPPDEKGRFASILLKASGMLSANAEGAFCVDDDDMLYVVRQVPLAFADMDVFTSALESLVDLAEMWREHAAAFASADGEMAQRDIEEAALNPFFGNADFIRV